MSENKSELYTFEEARAVLRTSKQKMRWLLNTKQIKAFRIQKNGWLIPKSAVDDYIQQQIEN